MHKSLLFFPILAFFLTGCVIEFPFLPNNPTIGSLSSASQNSEESITPISIDIEEEISWDKEQDNLRTGEKRIDIINLNDVHGAIETNTEEQEPGIAKLATFMKNKKAANVDGTIFTSSGDMWQGSADSNLTHGEMMVEWMNYMEFTSMAIGNHEFDWSIDRIKSNQAKANFPFLACNIIDTTTNEPVNWTTPYTTITKNGVHIGIIGAIGEGITTSISSAMVKNLKFDKPDSYVAAYSNYLKDNGADIIIYLYHESTETISSGISNYVDAIFGGHNHRVERTTINNVPAVEGGHNGQYVSYISLSYNFANKNITYKGYGYDKAGLMNASEDSGTLAIKAKYADEINDIKNEKVAYIPQSLDAYSDIPHLYNKYAYRYYNDFEEEPNSVFAVVTNNGRANISSGYVTYGDIYKALPFDNYLVLFRASGKRIKQITNYASSHWYIPSVSDNIIEHGDASKYFVDSTDYYVLTIDYISTNEYYSSWMTDTYTYREDEALPRNIFKRYLSLDYPLP